MADRTITTANPSERPTALSPVKQALAELRDMRDKLKAMEQGRTGPIAIIGMGCRFPGEANDPAAFWQLLQDGVDAITEIPADRWDIEAYYDPDPLAPGKMSTRWGGFLRDIDKFDPHFFGISPREAIDLDPQHRLLLEVGWEALENAGQAPDKLTGSRTGVFVGLSTFDYGQFLFIADPINLDAYFAQGTAHNAAPGRLSYLLGLQGPSMSVDTACSSSLVAIHLACQSLRNEECQMALVGGVNVILLPGLLVGFSKSQVLAADGRCKSFDAQADGFVRAEGCGMLVLKRLSDAQANGDNILAVIRGSAINQDGRSNGFTAPNKLAQEAVIREALANGKVRPEEVGYVEAHGTGTSLGDPIEVQALGTTLCQGRSAEESLLIGSVKTNLGHLESAAGVAGVMKVVLALQHKEIPPHLHLQEPNPYIPWDDIPVDVPTERTPFPARNGRYIAGVSSFGFSGTNAHVVLEAAPELEVTSIEVERPSHLLTLSARDETALKDLVNRFDTYLLNVQADLPDVCFTANTGRAQMSHRLAVVAESPVQAHEKLAAFAAGETLPSLIYGEVPSPEQPEIAFLFTGQGSQYVGMGRQLYETQPTFRAALDRCDEILRPLLDISLLEVLYPKSKIQNLESKIDETFYTQLALFALEYALAELWRSWGIEPGVVMGHSVGEYVAACVAGVFSLEDGLKLIAKRGQLTQKLPQAGLMVVVFADEARVMTTLAPYVEAVSIAAINGPLNTVISGERQAVEAVLAAFQAQGVRTQRLNISNGFHSPLIEPILAEFEQTAREIQYQAPRLPYVSNLSGRMLKPDEVTAAGYWRRHLREAVRFTAAVETLHQQGYGLFLEVGPSPTLLGMARRCVPKNFGVWLPSLRKGRDDWQQMLDGLATLYVHGAEVDWASFDRDYPRRRVTLPTYPFQRQRYWFELKSRQSVIRTRGPSLHPLLGHRLRLASQEHFFETHLSLHSHPFLADYQVHGVAVLPATAFLEMALVAGREVLQVEANIVEDLVIHQALILPEEGVRTVQVVLMPEGSGAASFRILSLEEGETSGSDETWLLHVAGKVRVVRPDQVASKPVSLAEVQARCQADMPVSALCEQLRQGGIELGPSFDGVEQVWQREGEILGRLRQPDKLAPAAGVYQLHPVLLDAGLPVVGATFINGNSSEPYLPVRLDRFQFHDRSNDQLWGLITVQRPNGAQPGPLVGDARLLDGAGQLVAEVTGVLLQPVELEALHPPAPAVITDWLYEIEWQPKPKDYASPAVDLLRPVQVAERLRDQVGRLSQAPEMRLAEELFPKFEALSTAYMIQACQQLGWSMTVGQRVQVEILAEQLGVADQHRRLFARIIDILHEDGILQPTDDGWQVCQVPELTNPQSQETALLRQYVDCQTEVRVAARCGQHLADVLRGQQDPLDLLFPGGSLTDLEQLYQNSIATQAYNRLVQAAVTTMLASIPAGQKIRILEIGGGTGSTTAYVLPQLPAEQVEYVFTDISPLFTAKASQKFEAYPFVRYETLDIEREPGEQGFGAHQYDLIVAANVLHATRDLRQSLGHVKSLLAPDGVLVLLEGTGPQRFVDLIFGLSEGWWRFEDTDLRPSYALISSIQWLNLLRELGFAETTTIVGEADQGVLSHQALLLARGAGVTDEQILVRPSEQSDGWLILADEGGVGQLLADRLGEQGEPCLLVLPGSRYEAVGPAHIKLDPTRPEEFRQLLTENFGSDGGRCRGVIYLWALDEPASKVPTIESLESSQIRVCGSALYLAQALDGLGETAPPALWLVTQGAQSAGSSLSPLALAQAPLWGVGRVMTLEHPELWGGLVDLDPDSPANEAASTLFEEIWQSDVEDQVVLRQGQRYVARLVRSNAGLGSPVSWRTDGTYLITGGLGYIGLKLAHRMAEQGVRHLVLLGRSDLPERSEWAGLSPESDDYRKTRAIEAIEALGATAQVRSIDVSDYTGMSALFEQLGRAEPPLRGVIHAAGAISPTFIKDMTLDNLRTVLRAKVLGTWVLHQLSQQLELDCFVMFSSGASVWGSKGLAHHAAANHFLDTMAHHRWALGLPGLSVNWGWWAESNFSAEEEIFLSQVGLEPMPAEQGFTVLEQLLGAGVIQKTVAAINWNVFKPIYEARRERPFLTQIKAFSPMLAESVAEKGPQLLDRLEQTRPQERWELLQGHVQGEVARVLGFDRSRQPELKEGLFQLGMDSLMAVELKSRLETSLDHALPATLTFDYPTIEALTGYLAREVLDLELAQHQQPTVPDAGAEAVEDYAELEQLSPDDVKALLDQELTAIDQLT